MCVLDNHITPALANAIASKWLDDAVCLFQLMLLQRDKLTVPQICADSVRSTARWCATVTDADTVSSVDAKRTWRAHVPR